MSSFLFRPATDNDMWDVHAWRNSERVRKAMLTQHVISRDEHEAWWQRKIRDPSFRMMLLEEDETVKAVQIYFDVDLGKNAWWAFYFTPNAPEDMGPMLQFWKATELVGLSFAFDHLKLDQLLCEVLLSNQGVLNWHKRFGAKSGDQSVSTNTADHNLEVLEFTLTDYQKRSSKWMEDLSKIRVKN